MLVRRDSESVVDFFAAVALSSPISFNVRPQTSTQTLQHSESSGSRVRFLSMGTRCKVQFGPSQLSVKAGLCRASSRWRLGAERTRQQNLEEAGLLDLEMTAVLSFADPNPQNIVAAPHYSIARDPSVERRQFPSMQSHSGADTLAGSRCLASQYQ